MNLERPKKKENNNENAPTQTSTACQKYCFQIIMKKKNNNKENEKFANVCERPDEFGNSGYRLHYSQCGCKKDVKLRGSVVEWFSDGKRKVKK